MIWTASEIETATGGKAFSNWKGGKLVFDSRLIEPGDIFIALKGNNSDGHDYIDQALARGAAGAIVEQINENYDRSKIIIVPDTQIALLNMAVYKRNKSKAKIIAITGSVGKTSTKELIGKALSVHGKTFISRANYNNFLGVPINLASIPDDSDYAVIEIGMDHAGEITPLSLMVKPHYCIITNIEKIHIANFKSFEGIAYAKSEIFAGIMPKGTIFLNMHSNYYDTLKKIALSNVNIEKIITLGKDSEILSYEINNNISSTCIRIQNQEVSMSMDSIIGIHQINNIMTSLSLIKELGLNVELSAVHLQNFKLPKGRGEVIKIKIKEKHITLIDDSYNAGPVSVAAALKNMSAYNGRKVAILGDMTDMGSEAIELHLSLKKDIIANKIDKIICFGNLMKHLYVSLPEEKKLGHFLNLDELACNIANLLADGDVLLIKGSYYLTKLYHFTQKLREGTLDAI